MQIRLRRIYKKVDCTVGCLQVKKRGGRWKYFCDTIEPHAIAWEADPFIGQKQGAYVPGKTAIPEGRYVVKIRESKTYKRMMPVLVGVPWFKTVMVRTGKTVEASRGDILIGMLAAVPGGHPSDAPRLENSRKMFNRLFEMIERERTVLIVEK